MLRSFRLRPAGLLAALGAVVAVACGTDYIELLPLSAGSAMVSGGSGGQEIGGRGGTHPFPSAGTAGASALAGSGGANGNLGDGGNTDADAGTAGALPNGGRGGSGNGYGGFSGCGGFGCGGFGGSPQPQCSENDLRFCAPCDDKVGCRAPYRCNERIQLCLPPCENAEQCRPARVCDPTFKTCGPCFSDDQCATQGRSDFRACELTSGRCVECNDRVACAEPEVCSLAQCVKMH